MAMNLDAVLRIAAKVVGLEDITALERGIKKAETAAQSAKDGFKAMLNSAAWQTAAVGAAAVGTALAASVKSAIDFESSMADVRKVVPGLEEAAGFNAMKQSILDLSTELPVSAKGLAEIMAAAGQAGIAKDQLEDFTRSAAVMGVAFDISAGQAGESMAKMRTSMGLSQTEVVNLADAMNFLSNSMASSAAEITDFMLRSGAVGKQVAMTTEQTAALGSAMIAAGAAPEVASTSFNNLIKALTKGETATERQKGAFERLGLSASDVAKRMQEDAVGTIRDVFMRISQLPAEIRTATISEVFGDEARALTPLITNMQLFDQAIGAVGDKSKYAGSMLAEFEARAGTTANQFQLFRNNIERLSIVVGDTLLPGLNMLATALIAILKPLTWMVQNVPGLAPAVSALAVAFVGFVAVAPFISGLVTSFAALKGIIIAVGAAVSASAFAATIAGWLGAVLPVVAGIIAAFKALAVGVLAVITGPVGLTVLLIAGIVAMAIAFRKPLMDFVVWLWNWGEPIRQFWIGLWEGLVKFVGFSMSTVGTVIATAARTWWTGVEAVWTAISGSFVAYVVDPITKAWTAVMELLPQVMRSMADVVRSVWTTPIETVKNAVRGLLQYVASRVNTVAAIINRLIQGFNSLPGVADLPLLPTIQVPAFAAGGTVNRPTLAMVGEGGEREYIVPESKMASASARYLSGARGAAVIPAGSGGGGSSQTPIINITTGPVMEMNGQRYVTIDEYQSGIRQAAAQIVSQLRTPAGKRALGVA
jgi:TP901 family phage tail tape measure protein